MEAVELVAEALADRGDVDRGAAEDRPHLGRPHRRRPAHPLLALPHVHGRQLALDRLDPGEDPGVEEGHRVGQVVGIVGRLAQALEDHPGEDALGGPVGALQEGEVEAADDVLLRVADRLRRRHHRPRVGPLAHQRNHHPEVGSGALQGPGAHVVVELVEMLVDRVGQRRRDVVEFGAQLLDHLGDLHAARMGGCDRHQTGHLSNVARLW